MSHMEALLQYTGTDSDDDDCHNETPIKIGVGNENFDSERHDVCTKISPISSVKDTTSGRGCCENAARESGGDINVDYFGMNDSSDSDEEPSAEISDSFFLNAAKAPVENVQLLSESKLFSAKTLDTTHTEVPDSDFWKKTSNHGLPKWTQSELPCNSAEEIRYVNGADKNPTKHKSQDQIFIQQYKTKRLKHSQQPFQESFTDPTIVESPSHKPYFVHHKIAPFLNQNMKNSVSKRKFCDLDGHNSIVNRIQWCPHSYSHLLLSVSMDKTVKIWNVFSSVSTCVQTLLFHTKAVKDAVWTSSGRQIISGGYDRTARLSDVEKGTEIRSFDHDDFVTCVECHPVNHNYFITGSLNVISCWDQRCGTKACKKYSYKEAFGQVQDLVFMPEGSRFLSCNDVVSRDSADRNIMAWDFTNGFVISNQIFQERFTCTRLRIHPHEAQFIAQTQGDYIALFSTIKPFKMNKGKRYEGHKVLGYNIGCDFSPDGQYITSGSSDGRLSIYDFHTSKCVHTLTTGPDVCLDVAWHPVLPSTVAMATWGGKISVWS